jgi:hypothetical protein
MMPGYDNFFANPQYYQQNPLVYPGYDNFNFNAGNFSAAQYKNIIQASNAVVDQTRKQVYESRQRELYAHENAGIHDDNGPRPLTSDLGNYRILRTSLLVSVPEIC